MHQNFSSIYLAAVMHALPFFEIIRNECKTLTYFQL